MTKTAGTLPFDSIIMLLGPPPFWTVFPKIKENNNPKCSNLAKVWGFLLPLMSLAHLRPQMWHHNLKYIWYQQLAELLNISKIILILHHHYLQIPSYLSYDVYIDCNLMAILTSGLTSLSQNSNKGCPDNLFYIFEGSFYKFDHIFYWMSMMFK